MKKNVRFLIWALLVASPAVWGFSEDFEGQAIPSKNEPPAGWTFVNVVSQAGTYYEVVADNGGNVGRVKCDVVVNSIYAPGYLLNTTGLNPALAINGSYDFKLEDEGAFTDGIMLFGDILNGYTTDFFYVKYQNNGSGYPAVIQKSAYPSGNAPVLAQGGNQISWNTWYQCAFTWVPTSGTTGTFSNNVTKADGTVVSSMTATITLPETTYFAFTSANDALRVDNIQINYKPTILQIEPGAGAGSENVPLDTMLKWEFIPSEYPVLYYDVWFGTDPNLTPGATCKQLVNMQNVTEIDPASPTSPWGTTLLKGTTYYWRVDTYEPNDIAPLMTEGTIWSFTTLPPTPVVIEQPVSVLADPGIDATFSVTASDAASYAWYKNDTLILASDAGYTGADTNALTVLAIDNADEGWYHCVPQNGAGPADPGSDKASLTVKRLMAHWKFDRDTDQAGIYTDSAEDHNGLLLDPNHVLTYVDGIDSDAIQMDAASVANAGAWNPSSTSNQLTVSCWVKMSNVGGYQGIIGKADSWGTTNCWSWRTLNNQAVLQWYRNNSYGPNVTIHVDQWEFICMTVGSDVTRAYVNGLQAGTGNFTFGAGVNDPIWIGRAENHPDRWFNGAIDDLRIYNYAISAADVVDEYNRLVDPDITPCLYPEKVGPGDINGDCVVNLLDLAEMTTGWLTCGVYPVDNCQ